MSHNIRVNDEAKKVFDKALFDEQSNLGEKVTHSDFIITLVRSYEDKKEVYRQ